MDQFEADIEALSAFHDALGAFGMRMADVVEMADVEIARALADLDARENAWKREVERCQEALVLCHRLEAASLFSVDCMPEQRALQAAVEALERVLAVRVDTELEIDRYRNDRTDFTYFLANDFERGSHYVAQCIEGFIRYRSQAIEVSSLILQGASEAERLSRRRSRAAADADGELNDENDPALDHDWGSAQPPTPSSDPGDTQLPVNKDDSNDVESPPAVVDPDGAKKPAAEQDPDAAMVAPDRDDPAAADRSPERQS